MPYITRPERSFLSSSIHNMINALNEAEFKKGALNYTITRLVHAYLMFHGTRYDTLSDITGVLNDVKTEFERRIIAPYEDKKIKENGDVWVRSWDGILKLAWSL